MRKAASMSMLFRGVTVPLDTVRLAKLEVVADAMVAVKANSTVLVPTVKVPAELSQLPATMIALAPAARMPPAPTVTEGVCVRFVRARPLVVRLVVLTPSLTVRRPPHRRPFVAIVKTWAVPAEEVKVTMLNSSSPRAPNVIAPPVAESNRAEPDPASHDALVELFVHAPPNSQTPLPKSM